MDSHTVPCHPKPNSNFIKPAGKVAKMVAGMTVEKKFACSKQSVLGRICLMQSVPGSSKLCKLI